METNPGLSNITFQYILGRFPYPASLVEVESPQTVTISDIRRSIMAGNTNISSAGNEVTVTYIMMAVTWIITTCLVSAVLGSRVENIYIDHRYPTMSILCELFPDLFVDKALAFYYLYLVN